MKPFLGSFTIFKKNEATSFSSPNLSRRIPIHYETNLNLAKKQLIKNHDIEDVISNTLEFSKHNYTVSLSDKSIKTIIRKYRKT